MSFNSNSYFTITELIHKLQFVKVNSHPRLHGEELFVYFSAQLGPQFWRSQFCSRARCAITVRGRTKVYGKGRVQPIAFSVRPSMAWPVLLTLH